MKNLRSVVIAGVPAVAVKQFFQKKLSQEQKTMEEHVSSLRPSDNLTPQIALAMYDGLLSSLKEDSSAPAPDGHWISAKLGRLAARS